MASQFRLPLMVLAIGLVAAGFATIGAGKDRAPNQDLDWLGVIAGDEAGSEAELAAEMAELFANDSPFRVVPVPGDSGLKNISRLLHDPHIDAGFISTDALAGAKTSKRRQRPRRAASGGGAVLPARSACAGAGRHQEPRRSRRQEGEYRPCRRQLGGHRDDPVPRLQHQGRAARSRRPRSHREVEARHNRSRGDRRRQANATHCRDFSERWPASPADRIRRGPRRASICRQASTATTTRTSSRWRRRSRPSRPASCCSRLRRRTIQATPSAWRDSWKRSFRASPS